MAEDEITLADAARLFKQDVTTLRKAVQRGRLEARRLGPIWVTTPAAMARWIADPSSHQRGRPRKSGPTER